MTRETGPNPSELTPGALDDTHPSDQTVCTVEPDRASLPFGREVVSNSHA